MCYVFRMSVKLQAITKFYAGGICKRIFKNFVYGIFSWDVQNSFFVFEPSAKK